MATICIIGNKDIKENISEKLKSFDYIVRINRCTNWEKTKTIKTDLWLMDIARESLFEEFNKIPKECLGTLYNSRKIFFLENTKNTSIFSLLKFNGLYGLNIFSFRDTFNIKKYFPKFDFFTYRISNFMWMVLYLLENTTDIIYITGADIEDRSHLAENQFHKECYKEEEKVLKKLIEEHKIKVLK